MGRRETALKCIDLRKSKGLELGPLFDPLVTKKEADIWYVDHISTDELKKKYRDHPIKESETREGDEGGIVPVDFALGNKTLKATVKGKKYDYVLASHVIEHIPDIISWLKDVSSVLNEGGILSLIIPDKRFTFDIVRNESRPADIIGAYLDRHKRASSVTMYDYMTSHKYDIVAAEVWNNPGKTYGSKKGLPKEIGYQHCLSNLIPGNYVDSHCSVFTPASFVEIIRALIQHDLFDYEVASFTETAPHQLEFFVSLRKVGKKVPATQKLKSLPKLPNPKHTIELEQEIARLRAANAELKKQVKATRTELDHVLSSKSWQITKPLRKALAASGKATK